MTLVQRYQQYYRELATHGPEHFFTAFDRARTIAQYFERSAWNFRHNILPYLDARSGVALDIGYGGGGMLHAAHEHGFGELYGVDVHGESDLVSSVIAPSVLLQGDGRSIPLPDVSVDVAWSWVTFMHLESFEVAICYLRELRRVLRPEGEAVIWYSPIETEPYAELNEDRLNFCSLRLSHGALQDAAWSAGMRSLDKAFVSKRHDGSVGQQHGIKVWRFPGTDEEGTPRSYYKQRGFVFGWCAGERDKKEGNAWQQLGDFTSDNHDTETCVYCGRPLSIDAVTIGIEVCGHCDKLYRYRPPKEEQKEE